MKKFITHLCLLLLCGTMNGQTSQPIAEAMGNYDYERALQLINQQAPTLSLLYQKGRALKGLGNNAEALTVFRQVMKEDSLNPRAYIEVAECSKSAARYDEALSAYGKALSLNPDNKYVRLQYITLLLAMKRYRESLHESELLARQDSSLQALLLRAESLENLTSKGQMQQVIDAYHDIRSRYAEDFISAARLGNIYIQQGMYNEATFVTDEYRAIDSTNIAVNRINAQAYCLNKLYPEAIQRYEQLLQNNDSTFLTCLNAGICYYAIEDFYKAHDLLEHARRENDSHVTLLYYLGRANAKTSWKKEGVEQLERAISLSIPSDSTMIQLYTGLADCYKMALRFEDQVHALLTQYKEYDPDRHRLLYNVAYIYFTYLNDNLRAEEYLERYLRTRPKDLKQEVDENGTPIIGEFNRYNAAEKLLNRIREKRTEEEFFSGKRQE